MTTNEKIQLHLRSLIRAVYLMQQCAAQKESGCALLCLDEHLNTVYKRAEEAEKALCELEKAPS